MLKKISVIFILVVALAVAMVAMGFMGASHTAPAFAEPQEDTDTDGGTGDDYIKDGSELVYRKITDTSGAVTERYDVVPSSAVMSGASGLLRPELFAIIKAAEADLNARTVSDTFQVSVNNTTGTLTMIARFDSETDYSIANGETGFDRPTSGGVKKGGFFFSTYTVQTKTVWSHYANPETIPGYLYQLMLDIGAKPDQIFMTYVFGTAYDTRAISTDADKVQKLNGGYLHTFYVTPDTADKMIQLVQTVPNGAGWYAIALIVGFAIAGAGLGYYFIQKKRGR